MWLLPRAETAAPLQLSAPARERYRHNGRVLEDGLDVGAEEPNVWVSEDFGTKLHVKRPSRETSPRATSESKRQRRQIPVPFTQVEESLAVLNLRAQLRADKAIFHEALASLREQIKKLQRDLDVTKKAAANRENDLRRKLAAANVVKPETDEEQKEALSEEPSFEGLVVEQGLVSSKRHPGKQVSLKVLESLLALPKRLRQAEGDLKERWKAVENYTDEKKPTDEESSEDDGNTSSEDS